MAYRGQIEGSNGSENVPFREPGARRKKLAGYLRAANELRQTYAQSWNKGADGDGNASDLLDFTNVAKVSTGEEQMILFPSYAKSHSKQPPVGPANALDEGETAGAGDAEYWRKQWERYEDDRAIVDVDVRGWLFTPQKGPLSRKHRLMVALARQLAGIPAPTNKASPSSSVSSSRQSSPTRRQSTVQEDQLVAQQAEAIIEKGEAEAEIANRGGFSERPRDDSDSTSIYDDAETPPGLPPRRQNTPQISPGAVSGGRPMTAAELAVANNNLMTRLKPFMASALTGSAINVFFYNETMSRQKTVMTDPYGHFSFRASLEFLPTHVRVLASEDLSIQEEVKIVASKGVSLISDVDDTVRHSAITKGAREIFRNAFVRDMSELTVAGVKEWYKKLADMGVQLHYVSNSPWQLFPALTNYFAVAELPQGSFHLKQYSGMLQGIFEPVAERKKATLERLLRDFPERKFILVGDSGEADLEVYTDVVIEHPGRVLGVFIRDVTSPPSKSFFDPSMGPLSGENTPNGRHSRNPSVDSLSRAKQFSRPADIHDDEADLQAAIAASLKDMELETEERRRSVFSEFPAGVKRRPLPAEARPALPPRRSQLDAAAEKQSSGFETGDLIDFSDDGKSNESPGASTSNPDSPIFSTHNNSKSMRDVAAPARPQPPSKPARLRSPSTSQEQNLKINTSLRQPPPLPRKPSSSVKAAGPSPLHQVQECSPDTPKAPSLPKKQTYSELAMQKLSAAYNALPAAPNLLGSHQPSTQQTDSAFPYTASPRSMSLASQSSWTQADARGMHSTGRSPTRGTFPPPGSVSQRRTNLNGSSTSWDGQEIIDAYQGQPVNKREEMWKRRWRRAKDIMDRHGVMLRTWRVGSDVMEECVRVVDKELEHMTGDRSKDGPAKWRR